MPSDRMTIDGIEHIVKHNPDEIAHLTIEQVLDDDKQSAPAVSGMQRTDDESREENGR